MRKKASRQKKRPFWQPLIIILVLLVLAALAIVPGGRKLYEAAYPRKYSEFVNYYADKYQIDPLMLYTVIRTESGFNPEAQSNVDARGLMQITQETFDWIKSKIAPGEDLEFMDLYDPETNIRFGSFYFFQCLNRYQGDLATAAAAYHSGWGTVDQLLKNSEYSQNGETLSVFPYTQMDRYVAKITKSYSAYQELYNE